MLAFLFALGISATNICFYKQSKDKCPGSSQSFSIDEFNKFKEQTYQDNDFVFYLTTSMNSDCVIDFKNIAQKNVNVSFTSTDNRYKIYLDFSVDKVFNRFHSNQIDIESVSKDVHSQFSDIILQSSVLTNLETLEADKIDIDSISLSNLKEIFANDYKILIKTLDQKSLTKISSKSPENAKVQFNVDSVNNISVIDTTIAFDDVLIDFANPSFKTVSFSMKGSVSFQAVAHSSQTNFPPFNLELDEKCNLRFVNSNFPIISPSKGQIYASITGSGTIEFENENAPFSIDCEKITIKLRTPKVSLFGSLFVRESVTIEYESLSDADLYLSTVIIASDSKSTFNANSKMNVHIEQLQSLKNSTNCDFTGSDALYSVSQFPATEIVTVHFSNFLAETKYSLNYILGQSSLLSIDSVKGSDSISIVANFVGSLPTESEVKDHMNEELSLVEIKSTNSISIQVTFPRYNIKGFDSATHIYSSKSESSKLSIVLDHELNDFNNYLCINGTESCPEGSLVFATANDFDANWINSLRETAEDIYFYFRSQYGKVVNFTNFIQNGNHPHVYFESAILILDQEFIQGELGPITINGSNIAKGTQIVINRKVSPVMLISPLELYNVMIAAHSIETINCTLLPYLKVDPISLSKYPQKCAANYLILDQFDSYTNFEFKSKTVVLSSDDSSVNDVTLQITDKSQPLINLTTNAKSVTFSASEEEEMKSKKDSKKFLSVFSKFEMTSSEQVINSNLSADYFDGVIDVHNFNGLLNVISPNEKVPLKFTNIKDLSVQSEANVNFVNQISIDGNVDLTKSDVSATFSDAHFGPNFQLSTSDKSQLRVNKAFFDSRTKQEQKEINGQLVLDKSGSLYVNSSTTLTTKRFTIESSNDNEQSTITVGYRLSEMPYINFGSFSSKSTPKVVFEYDESDRYGQFNEAEFSEFFAKNFNEDSVVNVICGKGINCSDFDISFKSSLPQFNGDTSIIEAVCSSSKSEADSECISLRFVPKPDDDDKNHKRKIILIVSITCGVVFGVCIIGVIIYCCVKKNRNPDNLNNQKLLNSNY